MKNPINVTTFEGKNYYTDNNNQPYSGPYIEFHKNGNKSEEGSIENGEKDGKWTYYNEDGSKKETIEYRNGQEYICSECDNKKGEITKEYCLSNPLNPKYEEEPDWEHDGGWNLSQMWKCRDFCKENHIENSNDDDLLKEEYNIHNLIEQDGILTKINSKDHVPFNGSVYQMVGGKWESKKVILGKIKDGKKVGKWTDYNEDGSIKDIKDCDKGECDEYE